MGDTASWTWCGRCYFPEEGVVLNPWGFCDPCYERAGRPKAPNIGVDPLLDEDNREHSD